MGTPSGGAFACQFDAQKEVAKALCESAAWENCATARHLITEVR
jgi:hypothetical protein